MSSLRDSFVNKFGESNAIALEQAAESHKNGVHDNLGSDYFRWATLIAIGYQCVDNPDFATYHKISVSPQSWNAWLVEHRKEFLAHDGDVDHLSAFCGVYSFLTDNPWSEIYTNGINSLLEEII
jgi:hypothetical protein